MSQILVIDAGGQYCHLIARRVRDAGVQARICTPESALDELAGVKGVIISGGPSSVYAPDSPQAPRALFERHVPVLGICYGHQLMAHVLGGNVTPGTKREFGETTIEIQAEDTILNGLQRSESVWMSHGDEVNSPPPGFLILARTASCPIAAMANVERGLFGIQFHPEVTHTPCGPRILGNFLFNVCRCEKDWDVHGRVDQLRDQIRRQVGSRNVLFFVSGGVDSTVAFTLCTDALGPDRVRGVFVDTGFMRKGERDQIEQAFRRKGWKNVHYVDRALDFLQAVDGISDPEVKRHRIGDCFLEVQRWVESEHQLASGQWMLGQGTIYPDTIESGGTASAAVIKTHHNRVPAIEKLIEEGLVLEPLSSFYKDEVRDIGRELGLPEEMVSKHPFPGPGLAVRCLCSDEDHPLESTDELRHAVAEFHLHAWSVPIRTVGVQGDFRSYSNLIILSGTANLETYGRLATKITGELRRANRVAFLVEPDAFKNLESARVRRKYINRQRLDLLREADAVSHEMIHDAGLSEEIWQFPVILLPLSLGSGETIALRPVSSADAMTAKFAFLPMEFIKTLGKRLCSIPGIDAVLYDVTNKPPGTIEWE